jgi:putative ABC transport system permease protein
MMAQANGTFRYFAHGGKCLYQNFGEGFAIVEPLTDFIGFCLECFVTQLFKIRFPVFLRTTGPARATAGVAQRALRDQAGPVVITNVTTLGDMVLGSVSQHRLSAWLFGSFGVLGLLLAAIGIVGVVSYSVAHRTREIGVRLALGASPAGVRRLVTRQALAPVAFGLAAGLAGALGLSRYVESLLFEVPPTDAATYGVVFGVLTTVALAAAYLPARRAARIDPMLALRTE